jgi:hypothetical protein
VATGFQALKEELQKVFEAQTLRIVPEVPVEGALDKSIKDTVWLSRVQGLIEIQVHWFLERACFDGARGEESNTEVKEVD